MDVVARAMESAKEEAKAWGTELVDLGAKRVEMAGPEIKGEVASPLAKLDFESPETRKSRS